MTSDQLLADAAIRELDVSCESWSAKYDPEQNTTIVCMMFDGNRYYGLAVGKNFPLAVVHCRKQFGEFGTINALLKQLLAARPTEVKHG